MLWKSEEGSACVFLGAAGDSFEHLALKCTPNLPTFWFLPESFFCTGVLSPPLPFLPKSGSNTWSTVGVLQPGQGPSSPLLLLPGMVFTAEIPMDTFTLVMRGLIWDHSQPAPPLSCPRACKLSDLQCSMHGHQLSPKLFGLNHILKS